MQYINNILFIILNIVGFRFFIKGTRELIRNINLGKNINRSDRKYKRYYVMASIALGQGKMFKKRIAGILHMFVYVGFIIVNLELIEIFIDGIFGTHRVLVAVLGSNLYNIFTVVLEFIASLVLVSVIIFFIRRNILHIYRLNMKELFGWPKNDANWILVIESFLMISFFNMNAADYLLQQRRLLPECGIFPISSYLLEPILNNFSDRFLMFIEKGAWWFHIVGVFFFMNYLFYSKHLHILFVFPNTWFSNLNKKGKFDNLESVTKEIKLMNDPNLDPNSNVSACKFGANDIFDLSKVQLLSAYSCTECGRCTAVCPANITGKKLSPRRIIMATRDRLEEVGKNINKNGKFVDDGKKLLNDYITKEELWACTTCNACVEACPVLIDPLSIILDMRRYLVMEQSSAPYKLNMMMTNIENNAAPWQYNQSDRLNWAYEN